MNIELALVSPEQKAQLSVIVDEYLLEHGQYKEIAAGPTCTDDYIYYPEYWREKGRFPYFILQNSEVVGFVLVRTVFTDDGYFYQVSEFCILPAFRKSGLGLEAVKNLWLMYPGLWELDVLGKNLRAKAFWLKCCDAYAKEGLAITEVDSEDGLRFQFNFEVK